MDVYLRLLFKLIFLKMYVVIFFVGWQFRQAPTYADYQVPQTFFLAFPGFIDRNAEECDRKQGREGSDTQQGDPGRESNPGPLQSLGTWVAHATNRAKRRPSSNFFTTNGGVHHFVDAVEISYPKNYPFHGTNT